MYDILIRNGTIIDGSGSQPYAADVAVTEGKIAAVGHCPGPAQKVIDAAGKAVTPGFIDIHRHADAEVFREGFGELELRQGLTTIINGNCGLSVAPIDGPCRQAVLDYLEPITGPAGEAVPTDSLREYLRSADCKPLHTGMLAGAGTIRAAVAGYACQTLDSSQIHAIQRALETALEEGALGVSLGLGYAPECFYSTEELISVLSVLRGRTFRSLSTCGRRGTPCVRPWRRCSPWPGGSRFPSTSAISKPWVLATGARRSLRPSP